VTRVLPDPERCWNALLERASGTVDRFFYGVRTTGVFCRPGCASRRPRREHVEFFATAQAAALAGYRPCRRCTPTAEAPAERLARAVEQACRSLEQCESMPSLGELAGAAGFSPAYFHRVFKAHVGVTPAQYARNERARRFREHLGAGATVTEAIYASGFGASSRAYESARRHLSMTPSRYGRGAPGLAIRYALAPCALGWIGVAATGQGVCAVELADHPSEVRARLEKAFPNARLEEDGEALAAALEEIARAVETPARGVDLPLDIRGTAFQQRVWQALSTIPAGATVTYAELARRIGRPQAVRAVAAACAANRLAFVIPCHRVIGSDGGLAGYRWGVERKRALLLREAMSPASGKAHRKK
jgi:AraC family transcriptional regulator, regulatory protein of adaptative response / methylated-DNA-[protein]-cysteine methyltransferase